MIDSRVGADGMTIRRRRECEKCQFRFSTVEEVTLLDLSVVKRDERKETYSRDKMVRGLEKALEKRDYTDADLQKLINRIERDIQKKYSGEITTLQIGELVMKALKKFDKVAYIRFASVYRLFEDVETFEEELRNLIKKKKRSKK